MCRRESGPAYQLAVGCQPWALITKEQSTFATKEHKNSPGIHFINDVRFFKSPSSRSCTRLDDWIISESLPSLQWPSSPSASHNLGQCHHLYQCEWLFNQSFQRSSSDEVFGGSQHLVEIHSQAGRGTGLTGLSALSGEQCQLFLQDTVRLLLGEASWNGQKCAK